jgi:hypothetical protein
MYNGETLPSNRFSYHIVVTIYCSGLPGKAIAERPFTVGGGRRRRGTAMRGAAGVRAGASVLSLGPHSIPRIAHSEARIVGGAGYGAGAVLLADTGGRAARRRPLRAGGGRGAAVPAGCETPSFSHAVYGRKMLLNEIFQS